MNWYKISKIDNDIVELIDMMGGTLVEEVEIDGYDLALIKMINSFPNNIDDSEFIYEIGLQRIGMDFTNIEQQQQKFPNYAKDKKEKLNSMKNIINDWLHKYGRIYLGSFNHKKSISYSKVLNKLGFSVKFLEFNSPIVGNAKVYYVE
jgi:hypothetical protein